MICPDCQKPFLPMAKFKGVYLCKECNRLKEIEERLEKLETHAQYHEILEKQPKPPKDSKCWGCKHNPYAHGNEENYQPTNEVFTDKRKQPLVNWQFPDKEKPKDSEPKLPCDCGECDCVVPLECDRNQEIERLKSILEKHTINVISLTHEKEPFDSLFHETTNTWYIKQKSYDVAMKELDETIVELNDSKKEIDSLKSKLETYRKIPHLAKDSEFKKIIEQAQSFRLSHEEWVFADELKELLEGKQ